jgi:hypothetical protein
VRYLLLAGGALESCRCNSAAAAKRTINSEDDYVRCAVNLSALVTTKLAIYAEDSVGIEGQGQTKRLNSDCGDRMLQQLVKIKGFPGSILAIVRMCDAALINMFYFSRYSNLTTASEPKLERPRVQAKLSDLFADQKLQIFGGRKRMHSALYHPSRRADAPYPRQLWRPFNQAAPRVSNAANAIASRGPRLAQSTNWNAW